MPVGTTADFDVTRDQLVDLGLSLVGVSSPSQTDRTLANLLLNSLLRNLDKRGDWLWTIDQTETTLTLISGQSEYLAGTGASLISPNISKLEYAAVYIGSDHEELVILNTKEALRTYLRDESNGQPEAVHLETAKLLADQKMQFFPTPNSAYSVRYTYRRPLYDFDGATNNPDFPAGFVLPLQKLLASEHAPHYGLPLPERQLLSAEGMQQFELAKADHASRPAYQPLKTEYF